MRDTKVFAFIAYSRFYKQFSLLLINVFSLHTFYMEINHDEITSRYDLAKLLKMVAWSSHNTFTLKSSYIFQKHLLHRNLKKFVLFYISIIATRQKLNIYLQKIFRCPIFGKLFYALWGCENKFKDVWAWLTHL